MLVALGDIASQIFKTTKKKLAKVGWLLDCAALDPLVKSRYTASGMVRYGHNVASCLSVVATSLLGTTIDPIKSPLSRPPLH